MKTQTKSIKESAILTVAAIRRSKSGPTEYLFNEKQRVFELRSAARSRGKSTAFLEHALDRKLPVRAVLDSRRSVIERIEPLSREEAAEFCGNKLLLEDPERSFRVDVAKIDPTAFNLVEAHLKLRCFRLCTRIIPNYLTAKKSSISAPGNPVIWEDLSASLHVFRSNMYGTAAMRAPTRCAGSSPRSIAIAARRFSVLRTRTTTGSR